MSNPAIVLMTDPSRCSLADVHHLVQALLEIQQMGQHAIPQAFCDHPAAASDFIDAYVHAYPQLVLDDQEIPTPEHLHSLITTGQIGALGQPPELAPAGDAQRLTEQNGANGFPIVVLTLGSSQALLDALQQTPTMRESIRLIDVGQDRADATLVSIADAVAIRGLDGEPWERDRSSTERSELDDIGGALKTDFTSLALHDDHMNLDIVETADVLSRERSAYDQDRDHEFRPVEPSTSVAPPAPVAVAETAAPLLPNDSLAGATTTEPAAPLPDGSPLSATTAVPALETTVQVVITRPSDAEPVEPIEPEAQAPDDPGSAGDGQDGQLSTGGPAEEGGAAEKKGKEAGQGARPPSDDVYYPPVGSLIAGADVLYPALDQDGAHGALRELASVLLDDGLLDADLASELLAAHRDESLPAPARQGASAAERASEKVVTLEDFYAAHDQDSEDSLADASVARPLHDSDL
jgi:hypothetical protein